MLIVHAKHKNSEAPYGQGASVRCHVQLSSSSDLGRVWLNVPSSLHKKTNVRMKY